MNAPAPSLVGILGRVFWLMLGPFALALLAVRIADYGNGWFTSYDFGFWVVLALMVVGRFVEFWDGAPQTADGHPATRRHLHLYMIAVAAIGLGLWALANVLGNFVMTR